MALYSNWFVHISVDSSIMLPKSRRARSVNSTKLKPILQLYNKLCQLVSLIGDLVAMENLTDIIILKVNAMIFLFFFTFHLLTFPFILPYLGVCIFLQVLMAFPQHSPLEQILRLKRNSV